MNPQKVTTMEKTKPHKDFAFSPTKDLASISNAYFLSTSGDTYQAQLGLKVDDNIINLNQARDVLLARWRPNQRINGQLSANYAELTDVSFVNTTDPFFEEGLCPNDIRYTKVQRSVPKKHYGVQGGLTFAAMRAGSAPCDAQGMDNQILDETERNLRVLEIGFRNSENWAAINGNSATNPLSFDGLDNQITAANGSLVVDSAGALLDRQIIDDIISIRMLESAMVTAIVANPLAVAHIQRLYYNSDQIMGQPDPYGFNTIPTPAGNVALVGDPAVPLEYTTPGSGDTYNGDVYLLVEDWNGDPLFYMDYLIPESFLPDYVFHDGAHCTSQGFGIYAVGSLVCKARSVQSKIENAGITVSEEFNTVVTDLNNRIL